VYTNNKKDTHLLACVFFVVPAKIRKSVLTCRWQVSGDGLTEPNLYLSVP